MNGLNIYWWPSTLKDVLISPKVLRLSNFAKALYLYVDASDVAIGTVLYQDDGPVAYFCQKLQPAQWKYITIDREFLAMC